ncbi:MAG TPA: GMC family oxidoreductase [Candidatus Binatia bacterium]|nr:GMC family oxidoreductase [Candidatus Binatia bacterium]
MANLPSRVPNVLGDTSLDRFDAIVIGSGAGGGIATRVLATNGLKVCVLEAGNNYFPGLDDPGPGNPSTLYSNDELKLTARSFIQQQTRIDPRTFRASASDGDRTFVGDVNDLPKTVGGGWVHADMKTPRFQEFDFRLGSLLGDVPGASFADWPLDYAELEPFYAAAERIVGVQGEEGADPFASPRSGPYPMPPGPRMYVDHVLSEGARKLGLHPFPYPSAVTSRVYRDRPPCNDCGFCSGYGCPINAKGSVAALRDALLTGNVQLRYNSIATRLVTDASGRRVTAVEYIDPDGNPASVSGDRVLLAASPVESTRLCLLSDPGGPGLGNSSGALGRHLMFHYQTIGVGLYPQDFHGERGRSVTGGIADFRGVPNDPNRPLGGIIEFGTNSEKIVDAETYMLDLAQRGAPLKSFLRSSPFGAHIAVLIMQGEDAPQPTNRVDLDPRVRDIDGRPVPRITYQPHAYELMASSFYGPKLIELHGAAGAQFAFVSPRYDGGVTPSTRHVLGTARMGEDPRTSVLDRFQKFHDLDNLWEVDGGALPTSSGYNPTLTIQALSLRAAGAIVDPNRPEAVIENSA